MNIIFTNCHFSNLGTGKTATFAIGILQKLDVSMRDCQALILGKIWIRANMLDMQHHIYHLDPSLWSSSLPPSSPSSFKHHHHHHHHHHCYHHLYHSSPSPYSSSLSFIPITILMMIVIIISIIHHHHHTHDDCSTNEGAGSADQDSDHCSRWLPQRPHPCLRGRNTRKVRNVAAEGRKEGRGDSYDALSSLSYHYHHYHTIIIIIIIITSEMIYVLCKTEYTS
jgi:hypothetical protein